jgi:molybdopterin-guanine dinucleotide biosynthesis protein A
MRTSYSERKAGNSHIDPNAISAFIIAGGQSRRFGEDKTLFRYMGRPLIELVVESVKPAIPNISIVADDVEKFRYLGLPCHNDIVAGLGPIGGIYTALVNSETERAFMVAADMPDLNPDLIRYMASISEGYDVTVPVVAGWYEPLHAIYSRSCTAAIEKCLEKGNRQITGFFSEVSLRKVTENEISAFIEPKRAFRNINYRSDMNDEHNRNAGE